VASFDDFVSELSKRDVCTLWDFVQRAEECYNRLGFSDQRQATVLLFSHARHTDNSDWQELAVNANREQLMYSVLLLGRLFLDHSPKGRHERQQIVLRMIREFPKSPVHEFPETWLFGSQDKDVYPIAKDMWTQLVTELSDDLIVLSNAAYHLALHDPNLAMEYLKRCIQLEPQAEEWKDRIKNI
jgi:hypothetical protein